MPRKTFHFEPDSEKVLSDLFRAYGAATVGVVALRGILAGVPHPSFEELALLRQADVSLLDMIRDARGPAFRRF